MAQITLNVDEEMLKEILDKGVKELSPEECKDIVSKALISVLEEDDYRLAKQLLVEKSDNYYSSREKASDLTKNLINSADNGKLQKVVDTMIDTLQNEYKTILKEVIAESLIETFKNTILYRNDIMKDITLRVMNDINSQQNQNQW